MSDWNVQFNESINVGGKSLNYYSVPKLAAHYDADMAKYPLIIRYFLDNLINHFDGEVVVKDHLEALLQWPKASQDIEIPYHPFRVLMQDFTGVPAMADLASLRDAAKSRGAKPELFNPMCPVDLVIDHSVIVDVSGSQESLKKNQELEYERNAERYQFLKWASKAFDNVRIIPPGKGICHQVNLEYLAQVVAMKEDRLLLDTLVGTDSHTTMVNGLGVIGWGVGGIEAEAAMLGEALGLTYPVVVGVELVGELKPGTTATDLVLYITQALRQHGVVGKFVEFYGEGVKGLSLADRATISNMSPEFGATCAIFPIDESTLQYLELTNRDPEAIERVKTFAQQQMIWGADATNEAVYSESLTLDIAQVESALAGPKRPQDRVPVRELKKAFNDQLGLAGRQEPYQEESKQGYSLQDGDVVIAAITSCTNTSNPSVMLAAGLIAKKAVEKGMTIKPWVKASLAPGSQVVTDYLNAAGLSEFLDQLGFYTVGYGCTTCIGNSGPLIDDQEEIIKKGNLQVSAVLSGNRNFEGRVQSAVKLNWLGSPPLVVLFALAGNTRVDLFHDPIGEDQHGNPVMMSDLWPSPEEISQYLMQINRDQFKQRYDAIEQGDEAWEALESNSDPLYDWQEESTYIRLPPFVEAKPGSEQFSSANILLLLGDSITTDHISPAGRIEPDSPAGVYLQEKGVVIKDFNSYGSRRGNHEVMHRGTFANVRIKNKMANGKEGGFTRLAHQAEVLTVYDAAEHYAKEKTPLVVIAGKEYGTGSSRDWAAKGTRMLGVKAVIAESFERIHRSNLVGMGVMPIQLIDTDALSLFELTGDEEISISCQAEPKPGCRLDVMVKKVDSGEEKMLSALLRIDTKREMDYFKEGGLLPYVFNKIAQ